MAIIKLGALVAGIRGTVGGVTFSASGAGPNARLWSKGSNPRSNGQSSQRGRFSMMPDGWRALTNTQRDDWAAWAADPAQEKTNSLGEPYFLNGYQWFVAINTNLLRAGFSPRDDPPTDTWPAAPVIDLFTFAEVASVFTCGITYDPAEFPSGVGIVIFAAFIPRGGRQVQYNGYRLLIDGIASPTGTYDFAIEFADQFGTPQVGDRAFLQVHKQNDQGMRGPMWTTFESYS